MADDETEGSPSDDQEFQFQLPETDFYSFLNIPKEATQDEIVNAYRRLSKLYHPDKHFDPNRKKDAELLFGKTKQAYEVLSDPHKRAIYDTLGIKGLETDGWEVVSRTKTPQEIREEYERLANDREYHRLQQRTNPKGSISVGIDATDIFENYKFDDEETNIIPRIEISSMNISQSIEAPLSQNNTVTLSGHLSTSNGNGTGSISCNLNHVISEKTKAEVEISAGNGMSFSIRGFRTLTQKCYVSCKTIIQVRPYEMGFELSPTFHSVLARHLSKESMGYLIWKTGRTSSLTSTVVRNNAKYRMACSAQLGNPNSYLSLSFSRKFEGRGKIKALVKYGTFGPVMEYGCEKKISEQSVLGVSLMFGTDMGVTMTLSLSRGNQSYVFPILLSEEVLPKSIFYGSVAPMVGWYALKVLIIDPYHERKKRRENEKARETHAAKLAERRKEATAAVELMREAYHRNLTQEREIGGLVVIKAIYGNVKNHDETNSISEEDVTIDEVVEVTIPLQCLVRNSKLIVTDASKSNLPGFYDPCLGEEKYLMVHYTFHNLNHQVTIKDNETLKIPKDAHLTKT